MSIGNKTKNLQNNIKYYHQELYRNSPVSHQRFAEHYWISIYQGQIISSKLLNFFFSQQSYTATMPLWCSQAFILDHLILSFTQIHPTHLKNSKLHHISSTAAAQLQLEKIAHKHCVDWHISGPLISDPCHQWSTKYLHLCKL